MEAKEGHVVGAFVFFCVFFFFFNTMKEWNVKISKKMLVL